MEPRTEPQDSHAGDAPHTDVPYTAVHRLVRRFLEPAQDTLVVLLALVLFGVMLQSILTLGAHVLAPGSSFRIVVSETLFVLVLVELQRLVIIYLRDHHVSVDVMVEATLVSALREILLLGVAEMEPLRLLAHTAFVLALGVLLRLATFGRRGRACGPTACVRSDLRPHRCGEGLRGVQLRAATSSMCSSRSAGAGVCV